MVKLFLPVIFLFSLTTLSAQVTQQWATRYTSSGDDLAKKIKTDASGNAYVLGTTNQNNANGNAALVKYNSAGAKLWATFYNSPYNYIDIASDLAFDGSGNIYITGASYMPGMYPENAETFVVKFNSAGVIQWVSKYLNGSLPSFSSAIALDAAGNIFISGYATVSRSKPYDFDYLTIKYNSAGVQQWIKTYNGTYNDEDRATYSCVDASGNLYVTGYSQGLGRRASPGGITTFRTYKDIVTIKYDTNGNELFILRYDNSRGNDQPCGIRVDAAGNFYLGGYAGIGDPTLANSDYLIMKYNSTGVLQWKNLWGNAYYDNANDLVIDGAGNSYITGLQYLGGNTSNHSCATLKYNSAGVLQWGVVDPDANSYGGALALDASGNVYVAGGKTNLDYYTIKYGPNGNKAWAISYNGPGNSADNATSIAVFTPSGPTGLPLVYVTGSSEGLPSHDFDIATIKYSQQLVNGRVVPLMADEKASSKTDWNVSVSPNPANGISKISYDIMQDGKVEISIYNMDGKRVQPIVSSQKIKGRYSEILNTSNMPAGSYQCIMKATSCDGVVQKQVTFLKIN